MTAPAPSSTPKRTSLSSRIRLVAFFVLLATVGFWAAKGAHTGWSMNQVPVKQTDEITGIEFVTYDQRFVPGIEFLGGGMGLAAGLFVVSLFLNRKINHPSS